MDLFFKLCIINRYKRRFRSVFNYSLHSLHKLVKTFPLPCCYSHCRNTEKSLQFFNIHMNIFSFRLVKKINAYNSFRSYFNSLQNKIEISFKTRSVADDYYCVRILKANKISGYLLLRRLCHKRIRTRNIC